jgi:predicted nucleic acid-binding protein
MDSSALVKIYIEETGSGWLHTVRDHSEMGDILTCEISGAEVFAAFHRRFRAGNLSKNELQNACDLFKHDFEEFFARLPVTKSVVDTGMHLIQKHPLRGYDSIQLATAILFLNELQQLNGEFLYFVGADRIINQAAQSEGLTVINPNERA